MATQPATTAEPRFSGGELRERLLDGLPLDERRLRLAGSSSVVLEGGRGRPLVLLHGGIGCGGAYWAPVVGDLASARRLIVPDVPGLGESEPVDRLDEEQFARWFTDLIELTCDRPPVLVAHSLLGSLAARFATRHGDLLRGLVLYGAPGVGPYRLPPGLFVTAIRFDLRPSVANHERFARWAFLDTVDFLAAYQEWAEAFHAYNAARGAVPHVKRAMRQLIRLGKKQIADAELSRIAVPTTLVWGRHDRMVPIGLAEDASARLGWPLHTIDAAGHVPHIERPEAFLSALSDLEGDT